MNKPPAFDHTCAALAYSGDLARLILSAKFGQKWHLMNALAELLQNQIDFMPGLIVPLPLYPQRLRERGFNQAYEIARPLAHALGIPLDNELLVRIRDTGHQARLHHRARSQNMHRAFCCTRPLAGQSIAIVDDIMTTGATLNAAACAMKKAGASRVDAWVLARTL